MRGLAEFVMSGRKQAILAVVLLGLIPMVNLLSPVVVGLVLLRKGAQEAGIILAWAVLPIGAWAMAGNVPPLILLIGISGLAGILRKTESWEFTLLAAIVIGVAVETYLRLQPAVLDVVFQQLELYLETNNLQGLQVGGEGAQLEVLRETFTSFLGAIYMFLAILLLMLARWMQASLFNPGGFQQEFHALRIEQKVALVLLGLMLLASFQVLIPQTWMLYLILPLVFSGMALVHAFAAKNKLSSLWLAALYAVLMLPVVVNLIVLLALVDSWYNFRKRF
ncbi:MAG: hypothetical protein QGG54_04530 [Gammaproteobacteria bacterium]|jgi:hypothetical protein|nr:hypothetical protein [Gammaproteobacteria bacterium]MDP6535200.1 hypothetical protein [Gammaproteobacteria bacterium]MDP6731182.1 hypothetical protein [Gammaproteobacteria bacterium]